MNVEVFSSPIHSEKYQQIHDWILKQEGKRGVSLATPMNLSTQANTNQGGVAILVGEVNGEIQSIASVVDFMHTKDFEVGFCLNGSGNEFLGEVNQYLSSLDPQSITFVVDDGAVLEIETLENLGFTHEFSEAQLRCERLNLNQVVGEEFELQPYQIAFHDDYKKIIMESFGDDETSAEGLIQLSLTDSERTWYGIHVTGQLVGTINLIRSDEEAMVTALAIHPRFQGKGYGKWALSQATQLLFQEGFPAVLIDVEIENHKALSLYQQVGFVLESQYRFYQ